MGKIWAVLLEIGIPGQRTFFVLSQLDQQYIPVSDTNSILIISFIIDLILLNLFSAFIHVGVPLKQQVAAKYARVPMKNMKLFGQRVGANVCPEIHTLPCTIDGAYVIDEI